jgi:hypothetical protein
VDIGCDSGEGVCRRVESVTLDALVDAVRFRGGAESWRDLFYNQHQNETLERDILTEGLLDALDETLPTLPFLSWLWLELGRLPWRLELDVGRISGFGRFGAMMGDVETGATGAVLATVAFASRPLRLRLL